MTNVDVRVIEQTVRIAAKPEVVWHYWTDPERMCEWWGKAASLEPEPGGTCRVEMTEGPVMVGEYLELEPYERLAFSFGWEGPDSPVAPGSTRVEVTFTADGDDTVMTLRHTEMPAEAAADHEQGWAHFLAVLAETAGGARNT